MSRFDPQLLQRRREAREHIRAIVRHSIAESQTFLLLHRALALSGWPEGLRMCRAPDAIAANRG